jgi:thioredoxin-related protein
MSLRRRVVLYLLLTLLASAVMSAGQSQEKIDIWFVHRRGCLACKQMKARLVNPQVAKILRRSFRVHMVDAREQELLPDSSLRTRVYPTLYFLDSRGDEIVKSIHNITTLAFWKLLKRAEDRRSVR